MEKSKALSDEELVEGIRTGDRTALHAVYRKYWPMVLQFVTMNNGNEDEAKDIYQETVIVLYQKVREGDFELISKLKTYLYAVSRRLWLKQLRSKSKFAGEVKDLQHYEVWDPLLDQEDKQSLQKRMVAKSMDALGESCRTILMDFFYGGFTMEEIAEKMGYTNAANAKNQKYKCFQRLKKLINEYTLNGGAARPKGAEVKDQKGRGAPLREA